MRYRKGVEFIIKNVFIQCEVHSFEQFTTIKMLLNDWPPCLFDTNHRIMNKEHLNEATCAHTNKKNDNEMRLSIETMCYSEYPHH